MQWATRLARPPILSDRAMKGETMELLTTILAGVAVVLLLAVLILLGKVYQVVRRQKKL